MHTWSYMPADPCDILNLWSINTFQFQYVAVSSIVRASFWHACPFIHHLILRLQKTLQTIGFFHSLATPILQLCLCQKSTAHNHSVDKSFLATCKFRICLHFWRCEEFTNYMLFHVPGFNSGDGACEQGPYTWCHLEVIARFSTDEFEVSKDTNTWDTQFHGRCQDRKKQDPERTVGKTEVRESAKKMPVLASRLSHNAGAAEALAGAWQCGHADSVTMWQCDSVKWMLLVHAMLAHFFFS